MAIIYTYPTKATPALEDLILISDTSAKKLTKNATIASLKETINVVDSLNSLTGNVTITGGTNITLTPSSNNIEINSTGIGPGTINKIPYFNSTSSLADTTITYDPDAPGYNFGAAAVITAYQLFPSNILDQGGEVGLPNQVLTAGSGGGSVVWSSTGGISVASVVGGSGIESQAGILGELVFESGFLYVCTTAGSAGNAVWKKTALSSLG